MILEEEVEKIRAVRPRIVARCGHDPKRLLEHYQQFSDELRASGQFCFAEPAPSEPTRQPAKNHLCFRRFGAQTDRQSQGRYPDGSTNLRFFTAPSPGAPNQWTPPPPVTTDVRSPTAISSSPSQ